MSIGTTKTLLGTIMLAVILMCTLSSINVALHIEPEMGPAMVGTNIYPSKAGTVNPKREEGNIPEILIEDRSGYPSSYADKVQTDSKPEQIAFPPTGL